MKLLLRYLFCLLTGIFLFSCQKNNPQGKLLTQAQDSLITGKPDIALNILSSIQNPEDMDKHSYMEYLATYVGAKKETKADISGDTLIFEVQRYFNDNLDSKNSALANYYAGWVYYTNNKLPQSLESFMQGADAADKSNNYLLAAKSFNNIGFIYFGRTLFDSAIVNYQKALLYYNKLENLDENKIQVLTNIGRAYDGSNELDSAYVYFNKALDKSVEINNRDYEFHSLKNLGVVCYGMNEYDKSIEYFESALRLDVKDQVDKLETQKIYLFLLNIYTKKEELKFAKQYAYLVISSLPEVNYIHTVKEMYSSLADYYSQTGDYKQALHYRDLEKSTKEQIDQETDAPALLLADKNFYIDQKDREAQIFRSNVFFIFIIGASAFCILFVFFLFIWRRHKKDRDDILFYGNKYNELRQVLYEKTDEYPKIEAEIKAMLEED